MKAMRLVAVAALVGALVACTEIGSDPESAVAIELDSLAAPTVVIGDTLRDTLGAVVLPQARALNVNNDPITGAPIRFLALDTGVLAVDSVSGAIIGKRLGQTSLIASIGGLQSDRVPVFVTLRPDTAWAPDSTNHTLQVPLTSTTATTSAPLNVHVGHDSTVAGVDTVVAVPNYLVRYAIVYPTDGSTSVTDTTKVLLANDAGRPSTRTTTSTSGIAARRLRLSTAVTQIPDSVVVEARVSAPDGTPLPGTPIQFVVHIVVN